MDYSVRTEYAKKFVRLILAAIFFLVGIGFLYVSWAKKEYWTLIPAFLSYLLAILLTLSYKEKKL